MSAKKIIAVTGATGARGYNEIFCRVRSVETSRALNPDLQSFADWLAHHRERIPIA